MQIFIGTQGWNYPAWVGPFYPRGTRGAEQLRTYARAFATVEVDSTFYATPPEPVVAGWGERVPEGFRFSLKVPQEITHEKRLRDAEAELQRFLERVASLGDRLGALLLQMPPDWDATFAARQALEGFLAILPPGFRWAIEFRSPRWHTDRTLDLLRNHGVALACADGRWLKRNEVLDLVARPTASFAYVRWMGDRGIADYSRVQLDREGELASWARALRALEGRVTTLFGYFNNHYQGHSPASARRMQELLGQPSVAPAALRTQRELFN